MPSQYGLRPAICIGIQQVVRRALLHQSASIQDHHLPGPTPHPDPDPIDPITSHFSSLLIRKLNTPNLPACITFSNIFLPFNVSVGSRVKHCLRGQFPKGLLKAFDVLKPVADHHHSCLQGQHHVMYLREHTVECTRPPPVPFLENITEPASTKKSVKHDEHDW